MEFFEILEGGEIPVLFLLAGYRRRIRQMTVAKQILGNQPGRRSGSDTRL